MTEDPYAPLAPFYDLEFEGFDDDIAFYEGLAARCELPVLELGAGTGRVALALARAGVEVWGIDGSTAMLSRAEGKLAEDERERVLRQAQDERKAAERVHLVQADMRDFELGREFDLAICAVGSFQHLMTMQDQLSCLGCVRRHLAVGGLLALDLRPVTLVDWQEPAGNVESWTRRDPETGRSVTRWLTCERDAAVQTERRTYVYDAIDERGAVHRATVQLDFRYTGRYELALLMEKAGLELAQVYGGYDLSTYTFDSPQMIAVARRPKLEGC